MEPNSEPTTTPLAWAPLHVSRPGDRHAPLSRRQAEALTDYPVEDVAEVQEREVRRSERTEIEQLIADVDAEIAAEMGIFWDYRTRTTRTEVLTPWMRMSAAERDRIRAARRRSRLTVVDGVPAAPASTRRAA